MVDLVGLISGTLLSLSLLTQSQCDQGLPICSVKKTILLILLSLGKNDDDTVMANEV